MGNEMQHLRFYAASDSGKKVQCVLFGKAQDYDLENAYKASVIGNLECQIWKGKKRIQLIADEIQFDEKVE
ncbi:hypothetical protein, partial [Klebsiella pneumoniae]|uniref:hypothetical protein n=1 Tax=Klebsiella pneumoniae TaxID=573 RepID=UPI0025A0D7B1